MTPIGSGRLYALGAALFYGLVTTCSRLAYDGGSDPQTVIWLRFVIAGAGIALALAVTRGRWRIPLELWPRTLLLALCWLAVSAGHLGAVYYIPVSLAALLFYTFPLQILVFDALLNGRRLWAPPFAAAFAGLALALGPDLGALDPRGVGLALLGSVGAASAILLSETAVSRVGALTLGFWMQAMGAVLGGFALFALGGPALPEVALGWAGVAGAGLVTVVAVVSNLRAVLLAGPARTGLLLNLEPVVIIAVAALVLDERLSAWQLAGVALVVLSLVAATLRERTSARAAEPG